MAVAISKRIFISALVWSLLFAPVFADGAGPAPDFHLSGVLISPNSRSALVNGEIAREGDRVAGARILAIEEGEVRIRIESRQATVRVGSTPVWAQPSSSPVDVPEPIDKSYGPVKRGETLSEIAERHLVKDITLNQLMIALFEANPDSFDNNINKLREGSTLQIPTEQAFRQLAAANAMAEVERHMNVWRADDRPAQQPVRLAQAVAAEKYRPVAEGETLSGIAASLTTGDTTIYQTMTALFHANTKAFNDNMNLLYEGAVLRIPEVLNQQTPAMAAAEVARHADLWRRRPSEQTRMAQRQHEANPPIYDPGVLAGGIVLSMNNSE